MPLSDSIYDQKTGAIPATTENPPGSCELFCHEGNGSTLIDDPLLGV